MVRTRYNPKLKTIARKLRKGGTKAEALLWLQLKGRKIRGYQFTRQKPIGNFIVDFYCPRLALAIEIDGISHDSKLEQDKKREQRIKEQGISVLRFLDEDVKNNMSGVISVIEKWIEKLEREHSSDSKNPRVNTSL